MKKFGHKVKVFYLNWMKKNSESVMQALNQSDFDFQIERSSSLNEFIKNVFAFGPEVVLADHSITSSCLVEAIEVLRQNALHLPVVLITDSESEEFAKILLKTGVSDYVFNDRPGRLPYAVACAVETERTSKCLREQVDRSREEFSDLIDSLPIGLALWNEDHELIHFNSALSQFSIEEHNGSHTSQWKRIAVDLFDETNSRLSIENEILHSCLKEGKTISRSDLYVRMKDGSKGYVTIIASPMRSSGMISGTIVLFLDGTSQKLAQLKSKALSDLLLTKNKELSQFAHIISHNLRDPIAKILGLASICDTNTDETRFIVGKITEEANRLDSVVKDLNVIVSVRNVEKENKERLSFGHEFSLVSQVLQREIQDSKALIRANFHELDEIYTVKSYLYSVMYNLLSNSIKYRDINKPLSIELRTYKTGQYTCLSVRDNGLGIDLKKNREKVFGLYKRFHSEHIPGKGVGLHFVKTYAEALGGKVEIDSQLNEGTELKVYFLDNKSHESE